LLSARPPASAAAIVTVTLGVAGIAAMTATGHGHPAATSAPWLEAAANAGVMMAAMMLPIAAGAVPLVEERALRRRRVRAVAEHVAGVAAVWFAFGAVAVSFVLFASGVLGSGITFVALASIATLWQLSFRRRSLMEREGALRTSPASGWRAEATTFTAGGLDGLRCMSTCWASMLALVAAPTGGFALAWIVAYYYEWWPGPSPHGAMRRLVPAGAYALSAIAVLITVLLGVA
jgi:predicted metal-binding membrane protein